MAIINGTFDTDLNGWNNNNASAYEVEVIWDSGRARLAKNGSDRITGCGAPWMNQRFLIDRDFLSFDWTSQVSWWFAENQFRWSLVIHAPGGDVTLVSEVIPNLYYQSGFLSGNKNIDVSVYKGYETTISFWHFNGGCTQHQAVPRLWIDNVILYELIANITATSITLSPGPYIQPGTITSTITWTNTGTLQGSFDSAIIVDGVRTVVATNILLDPGSTYTETFTVPNLVRGTHIICPDPN